MRALRPLLTLAALWAAWTAAAEDPTPRAPLPAPVAEAVRGVYPRGPLVAVLYDDTPRGREFEAQLKVEGRDAYVVALEDGVLIETGLALDEQALPPEVRDALRREAPDGGAVMECFRREFHRAPDGGPLETPCVFYEVVLGAGRDERLLTLNADGSLRPPEPRATEGE
jgi:hypothetical protein